jgi:putative transposase
MNLKSLNHSVYQLEYHIVWATKYRRPIFDVDFLDIIEQRVYEFFHKYDCECISCSVQSDHVHILVSIRPTFCLSDFIGKLKQYIRRDYFRRIPEFQKGYFISSVGISDEVIQNYISSQ